MLVSTKQMILGPCALSHACDGFRPAVVNTPPPSLARNKSFSRSLRSKKGLKKEPQTSVPVDVVFDTFEVSTVRSPGREGGEAGECACMCCAVFCTNTVGHCGCT